MKLIALALLIFFALPESFGQQPFVEGTISYRVKLLTTDNRSLSGQFIYTIKSGQVRKDLKLSNGYQYVLLVNTATNTAYSLHTSDGKNFAIQLTVAEVEDEQKRYVDFGFKGYKEEKKTIAGYKVYKGMVTYTDGSNCEIYLTDDWYPDKAVTYDRFPGAKFLPLSYTYKDESGSSMQFEADKVNAGPVENAVFKVPSDYKIISNKEYKQLKK